MASGTPAELKLRVGDDVFEVHVHERGDLPLVAQTLGRLANAAPQIDEATRTVNVSLRGGTATRLEGLRALLSLGIELGDISVRQPTLDEVFLALTGTNRQDENHA